MTKRAIIRQGDPTSHGGSVLEAFPTFNVCGKNAAGVGHRGYCPLCKRDFVIVAGAENFNYFGKNVAVEGMYTSCGALLIATQGQATIDDGSGLGSASFAGAISAANSAMQCKVFDQQFILKDGNGNSLPDTFYTAHLPSGKLVHGTTDSFGHTERYVTEGIQTIKIYLGHRESV